jgi:hypothetical protein
MDNIMKMTCALFGCAVQLSLGAILSAYSSGNMSLGAAQYKDSAMPEDQQPRDSKAVQYLFKSSGMLPNQTSGEHVSGGESRRRMDMKQPAPMPAELNP